MDQDWQDMMETLDNAPVGPGGTVGGGLVTAESWMARASALALCARDDGAGSDAALSGWVVFQSVIPKEHGCLFVM